MAKDKGVVVNQTPSSLSKQPETELDKEQHAFLRKRASVKTISKTVVAYLSLKNQANSNHVTKISEKREA